MPASPGSSPERGPSRRELLIEVALDVIAEHGVAGTTHRRVAAAAAVPLGSTTYYFADLNALLMAAFQRLTDEISGRFETRLAPARTPAEALDAVTDFVLHDLSDPREAALSFELYAFAARRPEIRALTNAWMERSQAALRVFFTATSARLIDTMVEGFCTYRGLSADPSGPAEVRRALELLAAARPE